MNAEYPTIILREDNPMLKRPKDILNAYIEAVQIAIYGPNSPWKAADVASGYALQIEEWSQQMVNTANDSMAREWYGIPQKMATSIHESLIPRLEQELELGCAQLSRNSFYSIINSDGRLALGHLKKSSNKNVLMRNFKKHYSNSGCRMIKVFVDRKNKQKITQIRFI